MIDQASELGRRWSPYVYTFDNPIRFLNPDGMWSGPGGLPDPFAGIKTIWYEGTTRFKNFISSPAVKDFTAMATGVISMATLNPMGIIASATTSGVGLGKFIVDIKPDITTPEGAEQLKNMPYTLTGNTAQSIAEKTGGNAEKAGKIGDAVENVLKLPIGLFEVVEKPTSNNVIDALINIKETTSSLKEAKETVIPTKVENISKTNSLEQEKKNTREDKNHQ